MSALARSHNVGLDLAGKVAAVAGGTQGIGAATSLRFAQAGASVYIIGRNAELGEKVIQQLRSAGGEGKTYEFIKADLSLVTGIKDVAAQLQEKTGARGIDYLVQTQGGPPNGRFSLTPEGHETHFAVQCLSRFGLAYLLAKSGTLKESIVSVCAPGGANGKAPNLEDLELIQANEKGKFGLLASGANDSAIMDGIVAEFAESFPSLATHHVFPGFVHTSAAANQGFIWPIPLLARTFGPLLARTIGNFPETYAEIPVYLAANRKSRGLGLEFSNQSLKAVGPPKWTQENPQLRKKLWEKMAKMIE